MHSRLPVVIATVALSSLCVVATASSVKPARNAHLQPLAPLAGYCWKGAFSEKVSDEHCFEWVFDGQFVRDRHEVRGGPPYSGETLYYFDPAKSALTYLYLNSDGGVSRGTVQAGGTTLEFPAERYQEGATVREFASVWELGADSYTAVTRERVNGEWQEKRRVEYKRSTPARP